MLKYFKDCTSKEECKKLYKKLAFMYHPDRGGDTETMKAINAEFDYVMENNIFKSSKKDTSKKDTKKDTSKKDTKKDYDFSSSQFKDIISALIRLEGLEIEITGCFIWVTGNTYPQKDIIKSLGFRYSRNKKAWYIAPPEYFAQKRSYKKSYSMNDIRNKYGSQKFESEGNQKMIG